MPELLKSKYCVQSLWKTSRLQMNALCDHDFFSAVGNDTRVNENPRTRQIPEVRSNLIEVNRSFSDLIQTTGHTRACTKRQLAWENAHGMFVVFS